MVPVKTQKLLLFIMQNTTKLYILNIGRLIIVSMEGFTKVKVKQDINEKFMESYEQKIFNKVFVLQLISLSISYFTMIYSIM